MNRIEIIFSQSLEEDLFEAFKDIHEASFFTMIPGVHGKGYSTPKMGDPIWPELNKLMIIYTDSDRATDRIKQGVEQVRQVYPNEGCAIFVLKG